MPAKSKAQQRFFGVVKGIQKGTAKGTGKAKKAARDMSSADVDDFASTKHKGLPNKIKRETKVRKLIRKMVREIMSEMSVNESFAGSLKKNDRKKFNKMREEQSEVLGYKLTGKSDIKTEIDDATIKEGKLNEAQEPLWNKDNVKDVIKQIQKGIKVPYADGLGLGALSRRDEHPTIIGKISVDPKKDWPNGYIENSRWALVTIYPNGVIDTVRMNGYGDFKTRKKVPILRKSKNKNLKQIIDKLGKYFTVVRLKYPDTKQEGKITEKTNFDKVQLPATVKRFLGKFVDSVKSAQLNRIRRSALLYKVIDAMGMSPQQLMMDIQRIKKELPKEKK